jgi:hypothetical protein
VGDLYAGFRQHVDLVVVHPDAMDRDGGIIEQVQIGQQVRRLPAVPLQESPPGERPSGIPRRSGSDRRVVSCHRENNGEKSKAVSKAA